MDRVIAIVKVKTPLAQVANKQALTFFNFKTTSTDVQRVPIIINLLKYRSKKSSSMIVTQMIKGTATRIVI